MSTANHPHLVHPSSYVTSSSCNSSTDLSSSQQYPYATYAPSVATSNKSTNLVVDSTSHLPEIVNLPSSSSILESTLATSHHSAQQLSPSELINHDNVRSSRCYTRFTDGNTVDLLLSKKAQSNSLSPQSTSTLTPNGTSSVNGSSASGGTQKRLHVSNIPFRFRDDDLKAMFEVSVDWHLRTAQ